MGAERWRDEYAETLRGAHVVIWSDNDPRGRLHGDKVAQALQGVAASVRRVEAARGKDAAEHLAAGLGLADAVSVDPIFEPTLDDVDLTALPTQDGAQLLDEIGAFLGKFVVYPTEWAGVAHALWVAHCHAMDAWDSTPRLSFLSPERGCGKTRALEVTELLVPRPVLAVNATPAYLFRKVSEEQGLPTILHDEIDAVFGAKASEHEDVRAMLNAGHRRGAVAGRAPRMQTEELPAYCAVALAGIGLLPDTILSRSVIIKMRRRAGNETVEPFRRREQEAAGFELRGRLKAWAAQQQEALAAARPEMPPGVQDRDADVWEALLAVADVAGGAWPQAAREAAAQAVQAAHDEPPSLGVLLLHDIREVWGGDETMVTTELLPVLRELEESPWDQMPGEMRGRQLDANKLARMLREFGITPHKWREGGGTLRGYWLSDFADSWLRYLSPVDSEPPPPAPGRLL